MYSSVLVLLLFCLHYKYIEDSVSGLCLFNAKSQQFLKMNFFRHDIVEKLLSATLLTHSLHFAFSNFTRVLGMVVVGSI